MLNIHTILLGIINPKYYNLISPITLLILGLVIKFKLKEREGYVGRLSMFSNSMALTSFYITIPTTPLIIVLIIDFSIVLGIIGLFSYATNRELSHESYYKYTRWFDSITTGILLSVYYIFPNLFM